MAVPRSHRLILQVQEVSKSFCKHFQKDPCQEAKNKGEERHTFLWCLSEPSKPHGQCHFALCEGWLKDTLGDASYQKAVKQAGVKLGEHS